MRVKDALRLASKQRRFGQLLANTYGLQFKPEYLNLYLGSVRVLLFYEHTISVFYFRNKFATSPSFETFGIDLENDVIPEELDEDIRAALETIKEKLQYESMG